MRAALADRLTLSEAVDLVGKLLAQWPNGRKEVSDGYLGALAATLADYPRMVALRCCDPAKGIARETRFLPTVADVVVYCERETAPLRGVVDRDDHAARIAAGMRERREADAAREATREARPTLAALCERYGPNWGLQAMDAGDARERNRKAVEDANARAYAKIGGTMSGDLLITDALARAIRAADAREADLPPAAQNETGGP